MQNIKLTSLSIVNFLRIAVLVVACMLALDSFGNPHTVKKIAFIESYFFLTGAVFLSVFARVKNYRVIPQNIEKIGTVTSILVISTSIIAAIFGYFSHANTVYALTRLQPLQFLLLGIYLAAILLINKSNSWWAQYWKYVVFYSSFFFFFCILVIRLLPFDIFFHLAKEDRAFEYIQLFILLFGSALIAKLAFYFKKNQQQKLFPFFILGSLALFFVAGEEISWGQRILNIEPTQTIQEINRQGEYTLHNLEFIHDTIFKVYVAICVGALSSRWILTVNKKLKKFTVYMPHPILFGYFLCPLSVYVGQMLGKTSLPWQEAAEIFFYAGILLWFLQLGILLHTKKPPQVFTLIKKSL